MIETVVTTRNPDGTINCAAMGVVFDRDSVLIRPFAGTRTLVNLHATPAAVVHVTDDVLLFAQAALEYPSPPTRAATHVDGAVIEDACSWWEVEVAELDERGQRASVTATVLARGRGREFAGWNRASHAVLEASILASRAHFTDQAELQRRLEPLQDIVDRTAGPREREAMVVVRTHIARVVDS